MRLIVLLAILTLSLASVSAFAQMPDRVQNIDVPHTDTTLDATWDDYFDSYNIRLEGGGTIKYDTVDTASYSVSELYPGTWYKLFVTPVGHNIEASKHFVTDKTPFQSSLQVIPKHNLLEITWDDPENLYDTYSVRVNTPEDSPSYHSTNDTSFVRTGLEPDTEYRVRVVPGEFYWDKAEVYVTTLSPPPDKIQNLDVTFTHDSISATWDDDFDSYEVRLFKWPLSNYEPGDIQPGNSFSVTDLDNNQKYRFVVLPENDETKKTVYDFTTLELPTVQNLQVITTHDTITATWDDYPGDDNVYEVRVFPVGEFAFGETEFTDTTYIKRGLTPDTHYRVVVVPDDLEGKRAAVEVWTSEAPLPLEIENLSIIPGEINATLSWDPVPDASLYDITVKKSDGSDNGDKYTSNDTSIVITGLFTSTEYDANVSIHDDQDFGTIRFNTTSSIPSDFEAYYEDTQFHFEWSESVNADFYSIEKSIDTDSWSEVLTSITNKVQLDLTNEDYNSEHTFRVSSVKLNKYLDPPFSHSTPSESVLVITSARPTFESIGDDFTTMDNWKIERITGTDEGANNRYQVQQDPFNGNPAPSVRIEGDGYLAESIIKTEIIDLSNLGDDDLYLAVDYRFESFGPFKEITNGMLTVTDANGNQLFRELMSDVDTVNTGWQAFTTNLKSVIGDSDEIVVSLSVVDSWISDWRQDAHFDNFSLGTERPVQAARSSLQFELNDAQRLSYMILNGETDFEGFDTDLVSEMLQNYNMTGGQN